ncbi:low temperature responsive protein [Scheffersomyces xylosifermentans]|uniref:low temperature responsive protein n=1 Tax=Scheffersomyces xylosifermentans TaxID=1304137 RepID=UPI00315D1B6E
MGPKPKIIQEQPNVENTIPVSLYQASSPEKFSLEDDDKFVIYGGGISYSMNILQNDPTRQLALVPELQEVDYSNVSLFVLNTSFIIWFNSAKIGLELPYQSIILHALHTLSSESGSPLLYLQIVSNEYIRSIPTEPTEYVSSVEIQISENEKYNNGNGNQLFANNPNTSIESVYEALSKCSTFHLDSDSEEEEGSQFFGFGQQQEQLPALQIPSNWISNGNSEDNDIEHDLEEPVIKNAGDADDLEFDDGEESSEQDENHVAGMNVDVGFASIAGTIRKRDEDNSGPAKNRRVQ